MSQPFRTYDQRLHDFLQHVEPSNGCWFWTGPSHQKGYGTFSLFGRLVRAHRFAYEAFVGSIPDGMLVCHKCDNPPCVRPDHLFVGTHIDNRNDMLRKGRAPRPEELASRAKLTNAQVIELRALSASGVRNCDLARRFELDSSTVSEIVRGLLWTHLLKPTS